MLDVFILSRTTILLLVFIAVVLVAIAVASALVGRIGLRKRLSQQLASTSTASGSLRRQESENAWVALVNFLEKRGLSLTDAKEDQARKKLLAAGYTHPAAPRIFTLVRLVLTLGFPGALIAWTYVSGSELSILKLYLFGAAAGIFGLYLPNLWISAKAERRRQALVNGFPDALDLMLVCVEAGLGLESAFDRVGREMVQAHPLVAQMLGTAVLEMRAGRSREEALRRMADQAGSDDIRAFTTLLIQSGKLGSSIAQTLRIYAAEMREKRRLRAEEKAHRLPVLISLPLVGCMLPVMIGVIVLPALIRVVRTVLPAMSGGG